MDQAGRSSFSTPFSSMPPSGRMSTCFPTWSSSWASWGLRFLWRAGSTTCPA
jgi:hypothetical protein